MRSLFRIMLIVMAAMMSAACVDGIIDNTLKDDLSAEKVQMTFSAVSDAETKLTLVDKIQIWWEPEDGIIINGDYFASTLTEPSPCSEFVGEIIPADEYHAVSSSGGVFYNNGVYEFSLPSYQQARKGNLPEFCSAAQCKHFDRSLNFNSLLGYVKFTIPEGGWPLYEVVVSAEGGETLALGYPEIDFSSDRPVLALKEQASDIYVSPYVYLTSDTAMEPGDYYIALYPGTYSNGLRFTFKSEDGRTAVKEINQEITLESGVIRNIGVMDDLEDARDLEREALITFYNAAGGDNWLYNDNWCSDKPVGEWWGVRTNELGLVETLDFRGNNNLVGTVPPEFVNLKNLFWLSFDGCREFMKGEFPSELLELTSLRYLMIDICGLSGPIPEDIGKLRNLIHLSLQMNNLTGSIPASIAEMKNLDILNLNGNGLTGDVPQAVQDMPMWINMWKFTIEQTSSKGGYINPETLDVSFPEFNFTAIDGQSVTDECFKQKEYTIYYHYGLNCPYSDYFTPILVNLYNQYRDRDIQVFSFINPDIFPTIDELQHYVVSHGIEWPNVYMDREDAYSTTFFPHVTTMPTLYVINREGKIIYNDTSYDRGYFPEFLAGLLGE